MFSRENEPYGDLDRGVLQSLGLVVVNFSWLEDILARATAWMIAEGERGDAAHLLARRSSFSALTEIFAGMCRIRFGNTYDDWLAGMGKDFETVRVARNELVHSLWDARESTGGFSIQSSRMTRKGARRTELRPTEKEVLELAVQIEEIYFRVAEFILEHIYPSNRPDVIDEPSR